MNRGYALAGAVALFLIGLALALAGTMSDQCAELDAALVPAQQCVGTGFNALAVGGVVLILVAIVLGVWAALGRRS